MTALIALLVLGQAGTKSQSNTAGKQTSQQSQPAAAAKSEKLQITDVKVGTGPAVKEMDLVTVDYTGKLTNGKVFDSSLKPGGTPFHFVAGIGFVIKGWDQGVIGMKVGGERKLVVPPSLAYGDRAIEDIIPAKSTLDFDIILRKTESLQKALTEKIEHPGLGAGAKMGDKVSFEFIAALKDGKVIGDNNAPNPPTDMVLGPGSIIEGMTYSLLGMKAGEIRTVVIPADLGFGDQGHGVVPPKSDIYVRIAMLAVNDQKSKDRPVIQSPVKSAVDQQKDQKTDKDGAKNDGKTDAGSTGTDTKSGSGSGTGKDGKSGSGK